jgi:hypothetical protein
MPQLLELTFDPPVQFSVARQSSLSPRRGASDMARHPLFWLECRGMSHVEAADLLLLQMAAFPTTIHST